MNITQLILGSFLLVLLSACGEDAIDLSEANLQEAVSMQAEYRLSPGDKVKLIVFGEENISGEYVIDGRGFVSIPLMGQIRLDGKSISQAEAVIRQTLASGYLREPRVNIEVADFRQVYIMGEVNDPGGYPYATGMNVINAVALAGGYTYRAKKNEPIIKRRDKTYKGDEASLVLPGDTIIIKERFF